jgi:hypothetical protein
MPQKKIKSTMKSLTNYKKISKISGKTIFIPGNHDWYNGIKEETRRKVTITLMIKIILPERPY